MSVSTKPWGQFSEADYDIGQWRRACLVDTGQGDVDSKSRYKLPVREPNGSLNRNGVHAAAGGHGIGAVKGISAEAKSRAARRLVSLYRNELNEDPPDSLLRMAGMRSDGSASMSGGEVFYRSFAPDLEVRSSGDGRTVYGIAVPWDTPVQIDDTLIEQFARGAFNHQLDRPQRVKFAREHVLLGGTLIGAATLLRNDAAGLYVELRAAHTPTGDETLELVRDGALDELSIMFREGRSRRMGGIHVERVKADLREVATVMAGAYGQHAVAFGVRSQQQPPNTVDYDLRLRAEEFLTGGGLPDLPDRAEEIEWLKLGIRPLPDLP